MAKDNRTIHDIRKETPTQDELDAMAERLESTDSPFEVALIGTAMVEHRLDVVLRKALKRQDDKDWRSLLRPGEALGTLNSKINLGYVLGLYKEDVKKNLEIIRDIRNAFAHAKMLLTELVPLVWTGWQRI